MNKKKNLGQFFTTNFKYILQDLIIPEDVNNIVEPFCGNGDLLNFIDDKTKYNFECYDIDPKKEGILKRDTLNNPPSYNKKFILTNPPYLARNKSDSKSIFDKYDVNDLYKCFMKEIIKNKAIGGIVIIPLNFWSSIRANDIALRKDFMSVYKINKLNIFEERVFDDTSYTVCSFQFSLKKEGDNNEINITLYPSKQNVITELNDENMWMIGGEIYNLKTSKKYTITRLTSLNKNKKNTNILVKCIDDNKNSKIGLSIVDEKKVYIDETPNLTARTYATLVIEPAITDKEQKNLVKKFNEYLETKRQQYNSLFLTNYRESKDIARKRISFDLVYQICSYLLRKEEKAKKKLIKEANKEIDI